MNLVSVRLLLFRTGIGPATRHIAKFGFRDAALPRNGSLALGAGSASPLDMVQGFAVFANGGFGVKPYIVATNYGADGETHYRAEPLIVCAECLAEPDRDFVLEPAPDEQFILQHVVEVSVENRPDAATAPELFENLNGTPEQPSATSESYIASPMPVASMWM